jgi:histidine ammonia-lyase
MKPISLGIDGMTLQDLEVVSREGVQVGLTKESEKSIRQTRTLIDKWVAEEKTIYGITTGFGALSDVAISKKDTRQLQKNILMIDEPRRRGGRSPE